MLNQTARRAKESLPDALELSPVRLIGGFVCVDSHLGCAGCHFCLNRRYPAQRRVLDLRFHRDWAEVGLPPERLARLVAQLPAIARGGVPVRFGHQSDLSFEVAGARALLAELPRSHPALLLTRFPPSAEVAELVAAHKNALLQVSIAPRVPGAIETDVPPEKVLAAITTVPPEQLFVMVGPLVEGSEEPASRLLPAIPRGAAVGFKPFAAEGVPHPLGVVPIGAEAVERLSAEARSQGLDVPPMSGCRLRTNLGIPFFRHRELVADTPSACQGCRNRGVCAAVAEPSDEALRAEADVLGLRLDEVRRSARGISAQVTSAVARADETYLSERLHWPVFLSGIPRTDGFRLVAVGDSVVQRWERARFYPTTELSAVVARMTSFLGSKKL